MAKYIKIHCESVEYFMKTELIDGVIFQGFTGNEVSTEFVYNIIVIAGDEHTNFYVTLNEYVRIKEIMEKLAKDDYE